jgi:hypothetical protein
MGILPASEECTSMKRFHQQITAQEFDGKDLCTSRNIQSKHQISRLCSHVSDVSLHDWHANQTWFRSHLDRWSPPDRTKKIHKTTSHFSCGKGQCRKGQFAYSNLLTNMHVLARTNGTGDGSRESRHSNSLSILYIYIYIQMM